MNLFSIYVENTKTKQKQIIKFEGNGVYKTEGLINEIDNYLTQFKSLDAFLTFLLKEGIISVGSYKCYLLTNNNIKKEAIFDNSFLREKSKESMASNNDLLSNDDGIIKIADELIDIISINNDAAKMMLYNKSFPKDIFEILKRIANAKFSNDNGLFNKFKNDLINKLRYYDCLRDCYSWINYYKSKNVKKEEEDQQLSLDIKALTPSNPVYTLEEYKELANIAKEKARELKLRLAGISNPNIEFYFNEGGLSSVLENCSIDEITALPLDEQEYIGFINNKRSK